MYIVVIAWLYVAFMMAVAEATSSTGSLLGAGITFLLYGAFPLGLVVYVMGAPARGRAIKAREQSEWAAHQLVTASPATESSLATPSAVEPDAGGKATADTVAPVRKET